MAVLLVVTGPKNSGKTTFCRALARLARGTGVDVAGVLTEKRWEQVSPSAPAPRLLVADLRSGKTAALGEWRGDRWVLSGEGIEFGLAALRAALPCDLLVIDELGPLELKRGQGWSPAIPLLAQAGYRLAVVTVRRELVGLLESRLRAAEAASGPIAGGRRVDIDIVDTTALGAELLQHLVALLLEDRRAG